MIEVKVTKTLIVSIGEQKMTLTLDEASTLLDELVDCFQPEEEQEDYHEPESTDVFTLEDVDEMLTTATAQVEN